VERCQLCLMVLFWADKNRFSVFKKKRKKEDPNRNWATLRITRCRGVKWNVAISRVSHGGYTILADEGAFREVNNFIKTRGGSRCNPSNNRSEC